MASTTPKSKATNSKPRAASAKRPAAASARRPRAAAASQSESNGGGRSVIIKVAAPALAGTAAVAAVVGGVVLGAKARPRKSRLPFNGSDVSKAIKNVDARKAVKQAGRAGVQFGELTRELRRAGEQAERWGKAVS
jgi:hypothetical protein